MIIDTLKLTIAKADLTELMNDTYLKSKKATLIFNQIPYDNTMLLFKFAKLLEKLQYSTELRLIVLLREEEAAHKLIYDNSVPIVTFKY